eukprot:548690-Pyramimonas_sp.AAC.1
MDHNDAGTRGPDAASVNEDHVPGTVLQVGPRAPSLHARTGDHPVELCLRQTSASIGPSRDIHAHAVFMGGLA